MLSGLSQGGFSPTSSQRRTPFYKQNPTERRGSWAAAATNTGPPSHISPQQHAQLERLYRQSIAQGSSSSGSEQLTGVQQMQMEFQKLCASTDSNGPTKSMK